jgi:hypothetical protein
MKSRFAAIAVLLTAAGGTVLGIAPASAAPAAAACPAGQVCFYKDANFQGSLSTQARLVTSPFEISNFQNSHFNDGSSLNDAISSVINDTPFEVIVFTDANFGGQSITFPPDTQLQQVVPNDALSSAETFSVG